MKRNSITEQLKQQKRYILVIHANSTIDLTYKSWHHRFKAKHSGI